MRFISLLLLVLGALSTAGSTQPQSPAPTAPVPVLPPPPVVVHVNNGLIALGSNYFDPSAKLLQTAGWNFATPRQSWVVTVNFRTATCNSTPIPPAIAGGDVVAVGVSQDGQNVFGWMDSWGSNPIGFGEGFFAPVNNPGAHTLIGFLPVYAETMIADMSANGVAVGVAQGGINPFAWTAASSIFMLPPPPGPFGGGSAHAVSTSAAIIYGTLPEPVNGYPHAGVWIWGTPVLLSSPSAFSGVFGCSPNGFIATGIDNFDAAAWIAGAYRAINEVGTTPLNGTGYDAVDSGFCVGVGAFGGNQYGFIWHPKWQTAMPIRQYVLVRTGVDIGVDVTDAYGISEYGRMLYITGADANGGIAIQVLARP